MARSLGALRRSGRRIPARITPCPHIRETQPQLSSAAPFLHIGEGTNGTLSLVRSLSPGPSIRAVAHWPGRRTVGRTPFRAGTRARGGRRPRGRGQPPRRQGTFYARFLGPHSGRRSSWHNLPSLLSLHTSLPPPQQQTVHLSPVRAPPGVPPIEQQQPQFITLPAQGLWQAPSLQHDGQLDEQQGPPPPGSSVPTLSMAGLWTPISTLFQFPPPNSDYRCNN